MVRGGLLPDSPNQGNFWKQLLNKKIPKYVLDALFKDCFCISLPGKYKTVQIVDFLLSAFEFHLEHRLTKICVLYTGNLVIFN